MAKTNTTKTKTTKKRAPYGFELKFPNKFTIGQLRKNKRNIAYITLYKRVEAALKDGSIVPVGVEEPNSKRVGRPQMIYKRVDAKVSLVSSPKLEKVAA
jgi:hypothetical protein